MLVAVSGGRDSVALIHLLLSAGYSRLILCHFDHQLRGCASGQDARFVEELAASHRLAFHGAAHDVAALAKERGESIETAARHARYAFFAQVARRTRCTTLLLGHHADDQVETLLFNLFRGSSTQGLGGMAVDKTRLVHTSLAPSSSSPRAKPVALRMLRPMLGIWRREIDEWVATHRLPYCEDASNSDLHHTRNRIRHTLIPLAKEVFGRDVTPALWRTADILRHEEAWMESIASQSTRKLTMHSEERLCIVSLASHPIALQRRIIHHWLCTHEIPDIGYREVELVRSLVTSQQAKINLPRGWHARRREKRLFLEKPSPCEKD